MARHAWSVEGQVWPDAEPLGVHLGERVQVALTNRAGMRHPVHLLPRHLFRLLGTSADPAVAPPEHAVRLPPVGGTARLEFLADKPRPLIPPLPQSLPPGGRDGARVDLHGLTGGFSGAGGRPAR